MTEKVTLHSPYANAVVKWDEDDEDSDRSTCSTLLVGSLALFKAGQRSVASSAGSQSTTSSAQQSLSALAV